MRRWMQGRIRQRKMTACIRLLRRRPNTSLRVRSWPIGPLRLPTTQSPLVLRRPLGPRGQAQLATERESRTETLRPCSIIASAGRDCFLPPWYHGGMEENPYKAPAEQGATYPRLTSRSRFHLALFITLGTLIGIGFAVMALSGLAWWCKAAIWAGVMVAVFAGYRIPPAQRQKDAA